MNTKKIIAILLACLMLAGVFAGCSEKTNKVDLGFDLNETIATVDDVEVKAGTYYYALSSLTNSFVTNYMQQYKKEITFAELADQKYTDTQTVGEYVKQYAYNIAIQSAVINKYFKDNVGSLTAQQEKEYNDALEARYKEQGGEKAYNKVLAGFGLTVEDDKQYVLTTTKYNILAEKLYGKGSENEINEQTALEKMKSEAVRVKHILVKLVDDKNLPLSGDKLASQEARYKEVQQKVDALAPNDAAGFDALIKQYNEDTGMYDDGYVVTKQTSFEQAFLDTAFKLDENKIETTKSSYGYHIIRRYDLRDSDMEGFLKLNYNGGTVADYVSDLQALAFSDFINGVQEKQTVKVVNQDLIDKMSNKAIKGL